MNDVGEDYNFLYPSIFIIDDLVNKIQVLYYLAEDIYLMHNHKVDYNDVREVFHIYDIAILSDWDDVDYHEMVISTDVQQQDEDENEDDFDYDENHRYNYKSFMAASN